jgi:hypothetical protein
MDFGFVVTLPVQESVFADSVTESAGDCTVCVVNAVAKDRHMYCWNVQDCEKDCAAGCLKASAQGSRGMGRQDVH